MNNTERTVNVIPYKNSSQTILFLTILINLLALRNLMASAKSVDNAMNGKKQ